MKAMVRSFLNDFYSKKCTPIELLRLPASVSVITLSNLPRGSATSHTMQSEEYVVLDIIFFSFFLNFL
jgi:hypothetical protein